MDCNSGYHPAENRAHFDGVNRGAGRGVSWVGALSTNPVRELRSENPLLLGRVPTQAPKNNSQHRRGYRILSPLFLAIFDEGL